MFWGRNNIMMNIGRNWYIELIVYFYLFLFDILFNIN